MTGERDVGTMGEAYARVLAAEANIVVNQGPHQDKRGWDLLFELPHLGATRATMPLDRRPGRLVARVQVKSGDDMTLVGRKDGVIGTVGKIKLSNWDELINWPQPSFYLVLDYDGGPRPQHAFLIHVGEALIQKVLERLRRESIEDPSAASNLHKKTMQLEWTEAERLSPIDGASLIAAIERHVGTDQQVYVLNKMELLREVGYTAGDRYQVKIQSGPQDDVPALSALADFSIGVRSSLEVNEARVFDNRFQLPFEVENLTATADETRISLPHGPPEACTMLVRLQSDDGHGIESMCRLYDSALLFPWFPEKHRKQRLLSDLFDIVLSRNGEIRLTVKAPTSPEGERELEGTARFAMALQIAMTSPSNKIALLIEHDGEMRRLVGFTPPTVPPDVAPTLKPVLHAYEIAQLLHLDPKTHISIGWLVQHAETLAALHQLLTFTTSEQRIQVRVVPIAEDSPEGLSAGILVRAAVRMSKDHVFFLIGVIHGRAVQASDDGDQGWHLAPLLLHVLAQGVLRPGQDAVEILRAHSEAAERWMESNGIWNASQSMVSNDASD